MNTCTLALRKSAFLLFSILLSLSTNLRAQGESATGLDYLEITGNPILTEIILELEPGLLEIYENREMSEKRKYWGLRGIAWALRDDEMYKPMLEDLESVSRPALLKFKQLPKEKYPTLHQVAEVVKLNMEYKEKAGVEWSQEEYQSNQELYKALHAE